jgi:hypothetical protein
VRPPGPAPTPDRTGGPADVTAIRRAMRALRDVHPDARARREDRPSRLVISFDIGSDPDHPADWCSDARVDYRRPRNYGRD